MLLIKKKKKTGIKVQKVLVEALNRYEKREEERKTRFLETDSEKYASSLSRQSSEIAPGSTNLVLVSREPLLYL